MQEADISNNTMPHCVTMRRSKGPQITAERNIVAPFLDHSKTLCMPYMCFKPYVLSLASDIVLKFTTVMKIRRECDNQRIYKLKQAEVTEYRDTVLCIINIYITKSRFLGRLLQKRLGGF